MTDLILRMLEAGVILRDFSVENPVRAIRQDSHDLSATAPIPLAAGSRVSALEIQEYYLARTKGFLENAGTRGPHDDWVVDLWGRGLQALRSGDHSGVATELDWVIKKRLLDRYRDGRTIPLSGPRVHRLLLAYHDISPG